jgi:hypothetical protein
MRKVLTLFCCLLIAAGAFAQSDRGTITGTISDPAGAVIASAKIEAKNTETGAQYQTESTATGNYTLAQVPAGIYSLSVSISGFKQYVRQGITVPVAQTLRIDVALEVGAITESVTVTADAALLKTESGELSHNVTADKLDNLPILSVAGGIRSPYAVAQLLPGANLMSGGFGAMRVNGTPGNTQSTRIEGQDATQTAWTTAYGMSQPGVDSIEEFAIQTSNFAAEFGQVGGGVFNITMRSGTNQFHGSGYEYFRNEALNAQQPFLNVKPRDRRHDFGFTFGGPVDIPKVYNGHDKTFFFFSFEQNRMKQIVNNVPRTVPTAAFRQGDFRSLLTGKVLGTDPLGRQILEGTIYDPGTARTVNGQIVTDPFLNNTIPQNRWDPVAAKFQSLIPAPTNSAATNNFIPTYTNAPLTSIPTIKMDHMISPKLKISGYWALTDIYNPFPDGFAPPVTGQRVINETTHTARLNFDYTMRPTVMLHFGVGLMHFVFQDDVTNTNYDSLKELGLPGTYVTRPPSFYNLSTAQGGMSLNGGQTSTGPVAQQKQWSIKPTSNTSLTWARNNHTYKAGAELRIEGFPSAISTPGNGFFTFSASETALPYLNNTSPSGGTIGFPYASFLLGQVDSGEIGQLSNPRHGKHALAFFAQDTWKVTRKLTLDYGLRYDFQTYLKEQYGRQANLGTTTPNPTAGNLLGGVIFEGNGTGRCNCDFASNYPYAFGPRLGIAYQITPKTVLRAGWGLAYGQTANLEMWSLRFGSDVRYGSTAFGKYATTLQAGPPKISPWPNYDPGQAPVTVGAPFLTAVDHNAGRPPRMNMWSIGLQREISKNLIVEAAYVGNRGVWWPSSALLDPNRLTPAILAKSGLDISKQADRDLLNSPLSSTLAIGRGFKAPYAGFPLGSTVAQSLRPYPQFGGINYLWAPLGNTWYDSLQVKVTKRYSHGLDFTTAFTWQKELTIGAETQDPAFAPAAPAVNDLSNLASNKYISGLSQPLRLIFAVNYTVPTLHGNKALSWSLRDWQLGSVLQYQSGTPIHVPAAQNQLASLLALCSPVNVSGGCNGAANPGPSSASFANRVPGVDLFTQDLNSKFDPNKMFVLNPKAWADPAPGQFGTSTAYYNDYRYARRPSENVSLGRLFRFKEGMSLQVRVELTNLFNRTYIGDPSATNALQTQITNLSGKPTSGFGYINTAAVARAPRQGQLVARFNF